jgi:hypothetical protein
MRNSPLFKRNFVRWGAWLALLVGLYFIGTLTLPGLDWRQYFSRAETFPAFYPPWMRTLIPLFSWPLIFAISVTGMVWGVVQRGGRGWQVAAIFLTLPFWMWLFLGSFDGIVLLGVLWLPWGIPLVLAKPQLAAFALLAKKEWLIAAVVVAGVLFVFTGWWPGQIFLPQTGLPSHIVLAEHSDRWLNYSLFPLSLLVALPLLYLSRGDVDLLLAAGAVATPYVIMYHYVLLFPGMGRLNKRYLVICICLSWAPYVVRAVAPQSWGWTLCNLFPLAIWSGIYFNKQRSGSTTDRRASAPA